MKTIEECEKNIKAIRVKEFHNLCEELHKEGKTGRIRFPKRLRDLHRKIINNYKFPKIIITSQLIEILNDKSLRYENHLIYKIQDSQTPVSTDSVPENTENLVPEVKEKSK